VLVACEFSGRVRDAFRARGHDAWSLDLEPTAADPRWHIRADLSAVDLTGWDVLLAFPPCTYLTASNAWRWTEIATQRAAALDFVRMILAAPVPRIAVENPAGAIGTQIRPADQYVDPWQFGDPWTKRTGLWLSGLPPLVPAVASRPPDTAPWCQAGYGPRRPSGTRQPGGQVRRAALRNLTFPGIARAMAEQWSRP
jgi:hypothetical protein